MVGGGALIAALVSVLGPPAGAAWAQAVWLELFTGWLAGASRVGSTARGVPPGRRRRERPAGPTRPTTRRGVSWPRRRAALRRRPLFGWVMTQMRQAERVTSYAPRFAAYFAVADVRPGNGILLGPHLQKDTAVFPPRTTTRRESPR